MTKSPAEMSTPELIRWVKGGGDAETARRIIANRHGEAYAVAIMNKLCGGAR